jgi:hypothetical protein
VFKPDEQVPTKIETGGIGDSLRSQRIIIIELDLVINSEIILGIAVIGICLIVSLFRSGDIFGHIQTEATKHLPGTVDIEFIKRLNRNTDRI